MPRPGAYSGAMAAAVQDDERLMDLAGELGQAIARGRDAGVDLADILACLALVVGEAMVAAETPTAAINPLLLSFVGAAKKVHRTELRRFSVPPGGER